MNLSLRSLFASQIIFPLRSKGGWIKRYVHHFNMQSRSDLCDGERKVEDVLTYLARDRQVAASTQNQALNALLFFYKHVLK